MRKKLIYIVSFVVWVLLLLELINFSLSMFPPIYEGMKYEKVVNLLGDDGDYIGSGLFIMQWKNWKGEITVYFNKTVESWETASVTMVRSNAFISFYLVLWVVFIGFTVFVIKIVFLKPILNK